MLYYILLYPYTYTYFITVIYLFIYLFIIIIYIFRFFFIRIHSPLYISYIITLQHHTLKERKKKYKIQLFTFQEKKNKMRKTIWKKEEDGGRDGDGSMVAVDG